MTEKKRGGLRSPAGGRPRKEPTVVLSFRVPEKYKDIIKQHIDNLLKNTIMAKQTAVDFLRDVCPNHTDTSKWNKSELLYILELHTEQLRKHDVIKSVCGDCLYYLTCNNENRDKQICENYDNEP